MRYKKFFQLPVAGCQLPVDSCQLPVASCQLSVASCQLPVTSYQLQLPVFQYISRLVRLQPPQHPYTVCLLFFAPQSWHLQQIIKVKVLTWVSMLQKFIFFCASCSGIKKLVRLNCKHLQPSLTFPSKARSLYMEWGH